MASVLFDDWVWSYSRLQSFCQCPWGFAQRYLYGAPSEPNFYSAYGSLIHGLYERWYKGKIRQEQLIPEFVSGFIHLPDIEPERRSQYLLSGLSCFGREIDTPEKIVGVERRVRFTVGGYRFQGIIDLMYEQDGGIVILDHKSHSLQPRSGRKKPTVKDRELDEYLRQLYLYAHAVRQLKLGEVKKLVFNCFRTGVVIEEPHSAAAELDAVNWAVDTIRQIEDTRLFLPTPDWFYCGNLCDTRSICDYRE
jgi:hypothetical protein